MLAGTALATDDLINWLVSFLIRIDKPCWYQRALNHLCLADAVAVPQKHLHRLLRIDVDGADFAAWDKVSRVIET